MPPPPAASSYQSYILRLWKVRTDGEGWRVRLTHVESGEQQIYTDLEVLFTYLREIVQEHSETGGNFPKTISGP